MPTLQSPWEFGPTSPSPGGPDPAFTVSLVVATRGRLHSLAPRLPIWIRAGFDEVLVVDGTYDPALRSAVRRLCERTGAIFVPAPVRLRDTRALSRNLGARHARGRWLLFQDDDDDVPRSIDREALRRAAEGKDWLAGPTGEIIVWHRREAFLVFGGYPEDMVAAEDWIMSNRARKVGTGGAEPRWYREAVTFPPSREDPLSRVRNSFWYGFTLLLFLARCPKRNAVILGDARRLANHIRLLPRQRRHMLYLAIGLVGRVLSPLHCFSVLLRSSRRALRLEAYGDWQGLRPKPASKTERIATSRGLASATPPKP